MCPLPTNHGNLVNTTRYQKLVGKLIYLSHTRPDIAFAVSIVSQFLHSHYEVHLEAVYRILRYLKSTPRKGFFLKKSEQKTIEAYTDADWAGSVTDRRSTSGYCTYIWGNLVTWRSKKQSVVARSSAEAEYRAMADGVWEGEDHETRKRTKIAALTTLTGCQAVDRGTDRSTGSSGLLRRTDWIVESRVLDFGTQACAFGRFPPQLARQSLRQCIPALEAFQVCVHPSLQPRLFHLSLRMAPRRESAASRAQGKRPAEPSQADQSEARRKASGDYFGAYLPDSDSHFLLTGDLRVGGPITSTVRGVEITLSPESICRIFDIPSVGLRVYESKVWPMVPGFEPREAIQRLCGLADAQGMGKPSAHSLTVISRILHHMVCSILLPRGGHRDEVSYLEAFIVDSILTGRRIHVGYLMMMHMISCCESKTHVLPYGRFLTRVFKDAGVDLSSETDLEAPTTYDTYDEQSLGRMRFEKAPDGSWIRRAERPPPQDQGQDRCIM
ncbi:Retrovirus-related Pol polyprotein from transposon RE1 [Vitis vinifera]|uniref:Retrovirus-related Pol polyprotein from transposon RE1 n=1 Tax=Vitis vinifera TaxID=29760 RepID=A0A438K6J9_VITVI|nr:Retrovirus-related Pol polyprotein from transposon RE1 [Vitis vinifera]